MVSDQGPHDPISHEEISSQVATQRPSDRWCKRWGTEVLDKPAPKPCTLCGAPLLPSNRCPFHD